MVRIWEYDVPEESRAEFERRYGDAGDWAQLFSTSPGFRGTELFASLSRQGRYVTVDHFTDTAAWERFLAENADDYRRLDVTTSALTTHERELV